MKNHFRICLYLINIWSTGFITQSKAQDSSTVRPICHSLHFGGRQPLNGSLPNGGCTSVNNDGDICNLQDGGTSVLVDNTIPPLNGLNGDWARDLYTVKRPPVPSTFISIGFDFGISVQVERVELVLFNCPQRSIRVGCIQIYTDAATNLFPRPDPAPVGTLVGGRLFGAGVNSCSNLYRVCVSLLGANNRIYYIVFPRTAASNRVYLAETIFYTDTRTCGDDTLVTEPVTTVTPPVKPVTTPPVDTTTEGTTIGMQDTTTTSGTTTIKDSTTTETKKDTTPVQTVITTTTQMKMNITTQDTTATLGSASTTIQDRTTTQSKKDTTSVQTVNNTTTTMSIDNNTVTVIATTAALIILALITGVIIIVIIVIFVRLKTQTNEKSGTNKHTQLNKSCNEESQTVELQCFGTADLLAGIQTAPLVIHRNTPASGYDSDTNTNKSPKFSTTIITQEDNNTLPVRLEEMHFTVQKSGKPKKKKARSESPPPIPPYRGGDVYAVVQKKRKRKTEDDGKPPPVPPQTTEMMYAAVHKKK